MTYFVVQVKVNSEEYVLRSLCKTFLRKNVNIVKSIYAIDLKVEFHQKLEDENIRLFLKESRLRQYLNDKRSNTFGKNGEKNKRKKINKEHYINGYIIIELLENFERIPAGIYYDIKTTPRVISIPNKFNVPKEEIEFFLNRQRQRHIKLSI
ncbi:hypothetical protein LI012_14665 [Caldibacillus thermoamylovorans]|uniref:hypothetical protein n=1 Tax=Caldibacillus thermoamylovorans TaxID=35841 RepID=UPI001D05F827|nr:hypothetical protein [Caldibacillus thermoamylovorans]MCB5936614.1 hypothetical protein [Bacillus sp. DFI.2.34]MCB7078050.1 hypothetical protein [Caldibacillus thermoamylovorans]